MGVGKVIYQTLQIENYDQLIELWEKSGLSHKPMGRDSKTNIAKQMEREGNWFLGAQVDGCLIGSIIVSHNGRKGWMNRLAVLPSFRKQKIASNLIAKAESFLLSEGIFIFSCLIENDNTSSLELFLKNDYVEHQEITYFTKRVDKNV